MLYHHRGPILSAAAVLALGFSILSLYNGFRVLEEHNITTKHNLGNLVELELAGVALIDIIAKDEREAGIATFQEKHIPTIQVLIQKPEHAISKKIVENFLGDVAIGDNLSLEQTSRILSILKTRETTNLAENLVAVAISANQIVAYALVGILLSCLVLTVGACLYFIDQTKRLALEKELLEAKTNLEGKVHERTKALEAASNAKTEFLAVISHELRTPLFAITGITEELGRIAPAHSDLIQDIQRSADKLLGIINQLLHFSVYDKTRPAIYLRPVNLFDFFAANFKVPRLEYIISEEFSAPVLADEEKLKYVLDNIVSNALKFSPEDKSAQIAVTSINNSQICIAVKDAGKGIPEEVIQEMFIPFRQGLNPKGRNTGIGLGLTISKHITENLSGNITVRSSKAGTVVSILLPLTWGEEKEKLPASKLASHKFLVVEDTALNRKVLGFMLKKLGQSFDFAEDGELGLKKAQLKSYDIILMDIEMPNMNGFESTKRIRELPSYKFTPIIAITSHSVAEILQQAKASGMNDWLTKPVNTKDLERLIREIHLL